jgi:hypothetical protein
MRLYGSRESARRLRRWPRWGRACGAMAAGLALTGLAATVLAAGGPACWLVVPDSGRAGAIAKRGGPALQDAGFDVSSARTGAAPAVLVVYARAVGSPGEAQVLNQFAAEGSALVLVYSLSDDLREPQRVLLAPWAVSIASAKAGSGRTDVRKHPITEGLDKLFVWRVAATLKGVTPILAQGDNAIAGVAEKGGRRLVVLPLDAVVPGQQSSAKPEDAMPAGNLQLLVQAVAWAAGTQPPRQDAPSQASGPTGPTGGGTPPDSDASSPTGPDLAAANAQKRVGFAPIACVDMPASDEKWPDIQKAVIELLDDAGLKAQDVTPAPAGRGAQQKASGGSGVGAGQGSQAGATPAPDDLSRLPLLRALRDDPALIVLGSCRTFDDAEGAALEAYVEAGGSVLALPHGTNRTNDRIVEMNGVLAKFGMGATLGRPAGKVDLAQSPVLGGAAAPGKIADGVIVIGLRGEDLATVGSASVLRADLRGNGRVVVADPAPLAYPKADRVSTGPWRAVLRSAIRWLIQGMTLAH